jgi:hypothetical protein
MARNVLLPCAAAAVLLTLTPVLSQSKEGKVQRVPVGAVTAQLTGRLAGGGGLNGEYELLCYLTFLEGFGASVFDGAPIERNAQFALRSDHFRFQTILNGSMIHFTRLAVAGTDPPAIRIYYLATPNRDFSRPDSFSEGQLVGVLRTKGIQGNLTPSMMFRAEGSAVLESASDFTVGDRVINLKSFGDSLTISLGGVPPSALEFASASSISVPFSGTIVAAERFHE